MPRGAITKRSSDPSPGGSGGSPLLSFANIAEMAAYPTAILTKGTDAHMLSLDELWTYDPTSTLAPDASASAPLGITIVKANGPGNWTRRQATSRRWRERNAWFVDPAAGSDEASGATALTAVGTFAEVMRRLQGLPPGSAVGLGYTVKILSTTSEDILIDTRHFGAAEPLRIFADPIVLFAGTITAHVDYDDSIPRVGTITCAGLPVSWTASGLVGKLARIPSTGVEFWIMEDVGAKTARISPPQAGTYTTTPGLATNVAFEVYNLVRFGNSVAVLSEGGDGERVDLETLELGTAGANVVQMQAGVVRVESCAVNGLDLIAGAIPTFFNCKFPGDLRTKGAVQALLANGYLAPAGGGPIVNPNALLNFSRFVTYNGWLVRQGAVSECAVADGWLASLGITGAGTAFTVEAGGLLAVSKNGPGRLWALDMGAGGTGIAVSAGGMVVYDNTKPILLTAPGTAVLLGTALVKTLAQLPYTDPITKAGVLNANPPDTTEDYFLALAADQNTTAGAQPYAVLLTQAITVNGARDTLFDVTYSVTALAGTIGSVALFIDGVRAIAGAAFAGGATDLECGSMRWRAALAAGAHTITVQWKQTAGQLFCRPVTEPDFEHCTLTIRELYG